MRFGFTQARLAVSFDKENVRSVSDTRTEYQGEIPVKTAGTYTDANGNKTVYSQTHNGSVVIRADFAADKTLLNQTISTIRNNEPLKTFFIDEVKVSESTISGVFGGMAE